MIYIGCPEKFATGGTELLHQLYYKLKKRNKDVKIYYYNYTEGNPVAQRFEKYKVEYVIKIEDQQQNLLIVPEVATQLLEQYSEVKKVVWWLSVDNYLESIKESSKIFKRIIERLRKKTKPKFNFKNQKVFHYVQSEYAKKFLKEKGVEKIEYLSDYLNDIFLKEEVCYNSKNRKNIVLYNPKKGIEFTQKIINQFSDIRFIPLENITPDEVKKLCKTSKVYIDFGNHPGKDRFPREAAILGCCIITGKKGAAKYYEDVRILERYKFEDSKGNIDQIGRKILEIFENYNSNIKDFEEYRKMIKNEETQFEKDIDRIFY